jgi:hypothetical protein
MKGCDSTFFCCDCADAIRTRFKTRLPDSSLANGRKGVNLSQSTAQANPNSGRADS